MTLEADPLESFANDIGNLPETGHLWKIVRVSPLNPQIPLAQVLKSRGFGVSITGFDGKVLQDLPEREDAQIRRRSLVDLRALELTIYQQEFKDLYAASTGNLDEYAVLRRVIDDGRDPVLAGQILDFNERVRGRVSEQSWLIEESQPLDQVSISERVSCMVDRVIRNHSDYIYGHLFSPLFSPSQPPIEITSKMI